MLETSIFNIVVFRATYKSYYRDEEINLAEKISFMFQL